MTITEICVSMLIILSPKAQYVRPFDLDTKPLLLNNVGWTLDHSSLGGKIRGRMKINFLEKLTN